MQVSFRLLQNLERSEALMKCGDRRGNIAKYLTAILLMVTVLVSLSGTAFACTAVYVGRDVSEDGTAIIAKCNDYPEVLANHVVMTERVEDVPGRKMPVDEACTVFFDLPPTTYQYASTPWMESTQAYNGPVLDASVCTNEYGVSMIMSITAFSNDKALAADPLVKTGITEDNADDLIVCQSATAREGVDLLAKIMDTYGSSEVNIAFISDQQETWYVEMYTGHQYAAVKLPPDKVSVFGNEFNLEYLSDYENTIVSPELESLAVENGFAKYGENGELNLYQTYSGPEITTDYSHMRTWIGHQILAPSLYGDDYNRNSYYPLCFDPDQSVTLQDVMELLRNRYEGTEYSPDETGRTDMRVIGTDTALSVHIIQTNSNLPPEMSTVLWESVAPAIYGVFVPVSNAATQISDSYGRNQPTEEMGKFDTQQYPWFAFKALNTLCVEKSTWQTYGTPVRQYWHQAEAGMAAGMAEVLKQAASMEDPGAANAYITDYCCQMQEQAFADAKALLNDVMWYMAKNSNTLKNDRDAETHQILDTLRVIPPMEVTLDGSAYDSIPEIVN